MKPGSRKSRMNLRHAAALALVGWYLMVPPQQSFKDHKYYEAPLVEWTHKATFDAEFECKQEISKGCHHYEHIEGYYGMLGLEGPLCRARCVATDDPRLKAK